MDITKTIVKRKRSKMETALLDIALHDDGNTSDDGWLEDSDDEWCVKRNNKESSDESNNSSDDLLSMEADKNLKHTQNAQDVVNNLACPKIVRVYSLSNTGTQEQRGRMGTDTDYAVSEDTGTRPSPHFSVQTTAKECRKSPDDKDVSHNKSKRIQLQPYQGNLCGEITSPSQYSVDEYVSRVLQSMCSNHNEQMFLKGPASLMNQITSKINAECKHMGVFARPIRQTTETACVQEKTEIMKMKVNEGARECTNRRLAQVQKDRSPHRSRAHHGRTNDNDAANCSNTCENTESRKTLRQYHSRVDNTSNSPDEKMSLGKVCPDVSERGLHRHSTERCMSRNADSQKSLRQTDNSRRKDASNSPAEPVSSEEVSFGTSKRVRLRDSKERSIGQLDDGSHLCRNADSQKSLRQTDNSRRKDASSSPAEPVSSEEVSFGTSKRVRLRDSKERSIGQLDDGSHLCRNADSQKSLRQTDSSRRKDASSSLAEPVSSEEISVGTFKRVRLRDSKGRSSGHLDDGSHLCSNADSQKSLRQTDNSRRKDASNSPAEPVPSEEASVGTSKRVHQRDSKGRFIGHQDDAVHHRWYIQYPKLGDSNTFHVCVNTANSRDGNTPAVGRPKKKICRNKLGQFVRCRKAKQGAVISELKPCIHSHPQRETYKQDNEARLQSCHNDICGSPSQGKVEDISRIETTEKVQELPKDVKTDVFAVAKEGHVRKVSIRADSLFCLTFRPRCASLNGKKSC
ncbi:uncharacterized protein [Diadema antillarum]|uniref:uncharacterized protein n=1 Tax=Diadema antillarum TaxID=105358 RepID=UPI003A8601CB